jgi:hypothetical protein
VFFLFKFKYFRHQIAIDSVRVLLKEVPALVRAVIAYDGEADSRRREITRDALMLRAVR